jgi:F0F1-type ATP synthase membrane subunit b/b'
MRKIGERPLTGAEKQRRHRERVKARLAEAAALKEQLSETLGEDFPSVRVYLGNCFDSMGATPDEKSALQARLDDITVELQDFLRDRAEQALDRLRGERRKARSSLVSRMAAATRD